jgi:hypothetical protein
VDVIDCHVCSSLPDKFIALSVAYT